VCETSVGFGAHLGLNSHVTVSLVSECVHNPSIHNIHPSMSSSASSSPSRSPAPQTQTSVQAGQDTQANLYHQVFGGDDSELSEDETGPAPRRPAVNDADDDDDDDEDEDNGRVARGEKDSDDEDEDGGEDAYVPATITSAAKIPKFKKKKRTVDEDGEGAGDGEVRKRRRKKKEAREKRVSRRDDVEGEDEESAPIYDETTRESGSLTLDSRADSPERRMNLEARIDNIGKKQKQIRRKKKGDDDVDVSVLSPLSGLANPFRDQAEYCSRSSTHSMMTSAPDSAKV
jgi:hypothetical protein